MDQHVEDLQVLGRIHDRWGVLGGREILGGRRGSVGRGVGGEGGDEQPGFCKDSELDLPLSPHMTR